MRPGPEQSLGLSGLQFSGQQPGPPVGLHPSLSHQFLGQSSSQLISMQPDLRVPSEPSVSQEFLGQPSGILGGNFQWSFQTHPVGNLSHLCAGTDSKHRLQAQQHQEVGVLASDTSLAVTGAGFQQQRKKRKKRSCKKANCIHCNATACGVCAACRHPERKNKCVLRYVYRKQKR